MDNVIERLNNHGIDFTLNYYGLNDLSTSHDIDKLINNKDTFLEEIEKIENVKEFHFNNYIDYLFLLKLKNMEEAIPYLKTEELKSVFTELINKSKSLLDGDYKGKMIKYINQNIDEIYTRKTKYFDLDDITLEIIIKAGKGISEDVFMYLTKEQSYIILDNYDKLQRIIENNEVLFINLFNIENIKDNMHYRIDKLGDILCSVKKRNPVLFNKISVKYILNYGEEHYMQLNEKNIVMKYFIIEDIYKLCEKLKLVEANKFKKYYEKSKILLEEYLLKNGVENSVKISYKELIETYKNEEVPFYIRSLCLTHSYDLETDKFKSNFNNWFGSRDDYFDSIVRSNRTTDNFFTSRHQWTLDIFLEIGSRVIYDIFKDKKLSKKIFKEYQIIMDYIFEKLKYQSEDLNEELKIIFSNADNIINMGYNKLGNNQFIELYGLSMFICSYIEKFLRQVYICIARENVYIPPNKITLGDLLNVNNKKMSDILGVAQMKNLLFILSTYGDEKLGYNYRNKLAHWSDITVEQISINLLTRLFYVLINIINSTFNYFYQKDRERVKILKYQEIYHRK